MEIYLIKEGEQKGPFSKDEISEMVQCHVLSKSDLVWYSELEDWKTLDELPQLFNPPKILEDNSEDQQLASRSSRFFAFILDIILVILASCPIYFISSEESTTVFFIFLLVGILAPLSLSVAQIWFLSTAGQTLGKKILKIRIVKAADGKTAGFLNAVFLRSWVTGILYLVPFVVIVDFLMIFLPERKCLHDFIAGTKVIKI